MKQTAIELPADNLTIYLGELMADFSTLWKKLGSRTSRFNFTKDKLDEITLEIKNENVTLPGFTKFQEDNLEHSVIKFVELFISLKAHTADSEDRKFLDIENLETKILSVRLQAQKQLEKIQNSQTIFREKNPFREVYLYKFIKRLDNALDGSR
jgi:hypothetical protein